MNCQDLIETLKSLGVPAGAYSVGSPRNETYSLIPEDGNWKVFYSERGNRNDEATYSDEDRACQDLFERITRDRLVQREMARRNE
jgi:hypothetical protein